MAKGGLASVFRGSASSGGLNERRIKESSGGNRDPHLVIFKDGETRILQFWGTPQQKDHFREFEQHGRNLGGNKWEFVPCIGDGCVPCEDEDEKFANPNYAFVAQVWDFKEKKAKVVSGGSNLAQAIVFKWKQGPTRFSKKVWNVARLATTPKSFNIDTAEERVLNLGTKEPVDIAEYLAGRYETWLKAHPQSSRTSLDDDDDDYDDEEDDIEEEDVPTRKQMLKMEWADLKAYAKSIRVPDYRDYRKRSELIDAIEETLEDEE